MPVFTSCAEMPELEPLMAATMPAGEVASFAMAMLLSGWVAVGVAMSDAPLLVDVRVMTPLLLVPDAYPAVKVPEKLPKMASGVELI